MVNPTLLEKYFPKREQDMTRDDALYDNPEVDAKFAGLMGLRLDKGFFVQQEWEILEYVTASCWEQQNEYKVFDAKGNLKLFEAHEETNVCCRLCCSENRPFSFRLEDKVNAERNKAGQKALVMTRDFRCCGWALFPCCAHEVDMHYMVDHKTLKSIGTAGQYTRAARVRVPWLGGCFVPTYYLEDWAGARMGYIKGPFCCVCDCCGAEFSIYDNSGKVVGSISKLRPATLKELAFELETEADNYQTKFDDNVSFNFKLATLASIFLIDFNFFEDRRGIRQCRCCDIYCCGWSIPCVPAFCFSVLPCCPCCRPNKKKKGTTNV